MQIIKKIRYFLEAIIVKITLIIFRIIGLKASSNIGAFLAKLIGKQLPVNNLARSNIGKSLPDLSVKEIDQIINGMWDNLGRIIGEFVHICHFNGKKLLQYVQIDEKTVKNIEYVKKNCQGGIIFSAHICNWEIGPKVFLENGINVKTLYRPLNNSLVDDMTALIRGTELISKSIKGNKQIISEIKKGNYVIILADQKVSEGIEVPFFNQPAFTTTSIAKLALKYDIPLIPARSIRFGSDFKFAVEVEKPLKFKKGNKDDVFALTKKINEKLENWIKQYPSQWFWVHNRWKR